MLMTSSISIRDFSKSSLDRTSIIRVVFSPTFRCVIKRFSSWLDRHPHVSFSDSSFTPKMNILKWSLAQRYRTFYMIHSLLINIFWEGNSSSLKRASNSCPTLFDAMYSLFSCSYLKSVYGKLLMQTRSKILHKKLSLTYLIRWAANIPAGR